MSSTSDLLPTFKGHPVIGTFDVTLDQYNDVEIATGGYLEAVSITDGATPFHYDAAAYAWSPDGGIIAEHEIATDAPLDALLEDVETFLQRVRADHDKLEQMMGGGE